MKQGDALSPLLFNLVLDGLIRKLHRGMKGVITEGSKRVPILAFANDMVLGSESQEEMDKGLKLVDEFLAELGMEVSVGKCTTCHILSRNKTWVFLPTKFKMNGQYIETLKAGDKLEYLGVQIKITAGQDDGLCSKLEKELGLIREANLKPYQKLELIGKYWLPRFYYSFITQGFSKNTSDRLDRSIRVACKTILKIPMQTSDGFVYTGKRDGGLGLPRLGHIVPISRARQLLNMQTSKDEACKWTYKQMKADQLVKYMLGYLGLEIVAEDYILGKTDKMIERFKRELKERCKSEWGDQPTQGAMCGVLRDNPESSAWTYQPELLKNSRFSEAVKLRTQQMNNRVVLSRYRGGGELSCRGCDSPLETTAHILGACPKTESDRINRHNEVCELIVNEWMEKDGASLAREPEFTIAGQNFKPDLDLATGKEVFMVEVSIRDEKYDNLEKARAEKMDKYKVLDEEVERVYEGKEYRGVVPIIIGTSGVVCKSTRKELQTLGVDNSFILKTLSLNVLISSLELYARFMDSV